MSQCGSWSASTDWASNRSRSWSETLIAVHAPARSRLGRFTCLAYAFQTFARGWRSSEPEALEPAGEEGKHEIPRRFERLCYWALAEGFITPGKAGELLQQPLAEVEKGLKGPAEGNAHRSQ